MNKRMWAKISYRRLTAIVLAVVFMVSIPLAVSADSSSSSSSPQSGSFGLEGTVPESPPKTPATITVPASGASYTSMPITISGLCTSGQLIKLFSNNVFIGSSVCANGTYSIQVDLFNGVNQVTSIDYDALGQAGPTSSVTQLTYSDAQFSESNAIQLFMTSSYAERAVAPGGKLSYPIVLSGGTAPYALSIDWGDGSAPQLMSKAQDGTLVLSHVYQSAGIYDIVVKETDANGNTAFLQLVGQATGSISSAAATKLAGTKTSSKTIILWPTVISLALVFVAFFLGSSHQRYMSKRRVK